MNLNNEINVSNATPDEMLSQAERDAIAVEASTDSLAVRNFSKKENPEERSELAVELRTSHSDYIARKVEIFQKITGLEAQVESGAADIALAEKFIQATEKWIERSSSNVFKRLLSLNKIKRWEEQAARNALKIEQETQQLAETCDDIQQLRDLADDRSGLIELRGRIEDFYQQQGTEYEKAEIVRQIELRRKVDVGNVIQEYGVTFVHGVYSYTPEDNSLIYENTPIQTKFKIALAFSPHLSASTIKPDQPTSMLCGYGLLVNGGEVTSASGSDSGTQPIHLMQRGNANKEAMTGREDVAEDIPEAIHATRNPESGRKNYNELTVDRPKFAGIYWSPDFNNEQGIKYERFKPFGELAKIAEEMSVPIFILKDGRVYRADIARQQTDSGENIHATNLVELTPEELADLPDCMPEENRAKLKDEVLSEIPFKVEAIKSPEVKVLSSISHGRTAYLSLSSRFNAAELPDEEVDRTFYVKGYPRRKVEKLKVRGCVQGVGIEDKIYFRAGQNEKTDEEVALGQGVLRARTVFGKPGEERAIEPITMSFGVELGGDNKIGWPGLSDYRMGLASKDQLDMSVEFYINFMRKLLASEEGIRGFDPDEAKANLAGHLYGFGMQAQESGDMEVANECLELASSVADLAEFQTIVEDRTGGNGRLRLKESDLASY